MDSKNIVIKRLSAALIDFLLLSVLMQVLTTFIFAFIRVISIKVSLMVEIVFPFLIFHFLLIFKDVLFRNASLGKKIIKIKIVDDKTEKNASVLKVILRNSLLIITLPLEIIFVITNYRRIGDLICKTKVVEEENT